MNQIEIYNEYNKKIEEIDIIKKFIDFCTKKLELKNVCFSVIIVNNDYIHNLNKNYRNIDRPTDVITFALEDNKVIDTPENRILGDIYISYDKAIEQAKEYEHSLKRELCFLTIHGILHLLGYDHMNEEDEKKMFRLQKELLDDYGIKKE